MHKKPYFCRMLRSIFIIILIAVTLMACSPYQKALKSTDKIIKITMAENYYKKKDYRRAATLFDQVYSQYLGKPQGERIVYMYGVSTFRPDSEKGDYIISSEIFKTFLEYYPNSQKAPDALFFEGKSHYMESPAYNRDQAETYDGINILQQYVNQYPEGEHFQKANKLISTMTTKIEKKSFENAKQYWTIEDYKACTRALELFLIEYPGSVYSEDAYYYMLQSAYTVATNSVSSKEKERLDKTIKIYKTLKKRFPNTKYAKQVNQMYNKVLEYVENYNNPKNNTPS